jgi:hypothetical protein
LGKRFVILMFDIQVFSDILMKVGASRLGRTLSRVVVGIVGVLILAGFLAAMLTPKAVETLFPVIVGFNTALTGYSVIDKTRNAYEHKRLVATGAGFLVVLLATLAANLLFWQMAGVIPIGADKLWVLLPVGIFTSWLGSALAIKYFKLN